VWIPNLGDLPIIASVSLTHIPCLFACFHESVSCVYTFFSPCLSTCVALAACFVLGSVLLTAFLFCFFSCYEFNGHLCHGAYWCAHNPAHMPILLFQLHLPFSNSCVCVYISENVYAIPSPSIFLHTYRHIHMYVLCSVLYSQPPFCFLFSFSTHLIDTYVTVPIDVRIILLLWKHIRENLYVFPDMYLSVCQCTRMYVRV